MQWPFNYPGDNYFTNVYGQIIIIAEEAKEKVIDAIDAIKDAVGEILDD